MACVCVASGRRGARARRIDRLLRTQYDNCCSELALVSDRFLDEGHKRFYANNGQNMVVDLAFREKMHQRNERVGAHDLATRVLVDEAFYHWFDPTYDCDLTLRYSDFTRE